VGRPDPKIGDLQWVCGEVGVPNSWGKKLLWPDMYTKPFSVQAIATTLGPEVGGRQKQKHEQQAASRDRSVEEAEINRQLRGRRRRTRSLGGGSAARLGEKRSLAKGSA